MIELIAIFIFGAPFWMCLLKLLAWIASFSLGWGMAYAIGFGISFIMLIISNGRASKPTINVRVRR